VLADAMTIGTLFAFITYEGMIIWPIRHMGRVLTDSGKAVVALKRMAEILSEPEESNLEHALTAPLSGQIKQPRRDSRCFNFTLELTCRFGSL
jgi:ATP-binding cassette subfamily B protein